MFFTLLLLLSFVWSILAPLSLIVLTVSVTTAHSDKLHQEPIPRPPRAGRKQEIKAWVTVNPDHSLNLNLQIDDEDPITRPLETKYHCETCKLSRTYLKHHVCCDPRTRKSLKDEKDTLFDHGTEMSERTSLNQHTVKTLAFLGDRLLAIRVTQLRGHHDQQVLSSLVSDENLAIYARDTLGFRQKDTKALASAFEAQIALTPSIADSYLEHKLGTLPKNPIYPGLYPDH